MIGTVERAFQLARSGKCQSLRDVRQKLRREQYDAVEAHVTGTLGRQLTALMKHGG